jgi:hypothetical protein
VGVFWCFPSFLMNIVIFPNMGTVNNGLFFYLVCFFVLLRLKGLFLAVPIFPVLLLFISNFLTIWSANNGLFSI